MNGEKPLNILADQENKPDITVTSKSFAQNTPPANPITPPLEKPQTQLQEELSNTIGQVTPPKKNAEIVQPTPTTPDKKSFLGDFKNFLQKPIRTYESDVADLMSKNKTSIATMTIAETKKKEVEIKKLDTSTQTQAQTVGQSRKSYVKQITLGILSLIFIGGGIFGGYYLYQQSALAIPDPIPKPLVIPSIFPADKQNILITNNLKKDELIAQTVSQSTQDLASDQKFLEMILGKKEGEKSLRIGASTFIKQVEFDIPDILLRSLLDRWMIGSYSEDSGDKSMFIIFTTDFFQNAYNGMLTWEESMPDDLAVLLNFKDRARANENDGSSPLASYFTIRGKFIDKQIKNRDVREFVSNNNEILFLYSFIDKDTIVLTTTEKSLEAILERLNKQTYVR